MAIVDSTYYSTTFVGEPVASTDWARYDARAERTIARLTHGRVTGTTFSSLPSWQQDAVKNAICSQIEFYVYYGIDVANAGRQATGFSVGEVRVDGSSEIPVGAKSMVSPAAIAELETTGLMNPQVETHGSPGLYPWGEY